MRYPTLAGLVLLVGCGQLENVLDRVTLSDAELQEASENYAGALAAFKELEAFAVQVSEGSVDLEGAEFVAPAAENGWVGTIHFVSDQFPGGAGELDLSFSVDGEDGPIDPFLVDTANDPIVRLSMQVTFTGQTTEGADLSFEADFTIVTDRTQADREVVTTNGTFRISHNLYVADLTADNLTIVFDAATGALIDGSGAIRGSMEIPDYTFDADVDIAVNGTVVNVLVEVLNQEIENSQTDLSLFVGGATAP